MTEAELFRAKLNNLKAPELTKVVPLSRIEAEILIEKLDDTSDTITDDIIAATPPKERETEQFRTWRSKARGAREHMRNRIHTLRCLWPDAALPEAYEDHAVLLEKVMPLIARIGILKERTHIALMWSEKEIAIAREVFAAMEAMNREHAG